MNRIGQATGVAMTAWLLALSGAHAGNLDSPAATNNAGSSMWTLDAIYNVLDTRAANVAKRTTVFNNPTSGPTAGTMHTLNEIMGLVTNRAPVAKTGQTTSYGPRDDGALKMGVTFPGTRFVVVGADGTAETNQVRDTLTGLIWARDGNLFGSTNWSAALTNCNTLVYGGTNDWRMPNVLEMASLINFTTWQTPLVYGSYWRGVVSGDYWTSTTAGTLSPADAWKFSLNYGELYRWQKTSSCYTWPVRGGGR